MSDKTNAVPTYGISMRLKQQHRDRIDAAARAAGMSRNGFMLHASLTEADRVLGAREGSE